MRYRITFAKTAAMRYTSHLDLQRSLERTFRRAGLPLLYSQGYNPRPRLNLASALPLGFTSEAELADVWLEGSLPPQDIQADLEAATSPGVRFQQVQRVDDSAPKLPNLLQSAEYVVTLHSTLENLDRRLADLLAAASLERRRQGKTYDLRPLVEHLQRLTDTQEGQQQVLMRLTARPGATGRPDEVLAALDVAPEDAQVHRTRLILAVPE